MASAFAAERLPRQCLLCQRRVRSDSQLLCQTSYRSPLCYYTILQIQPSSVHLRYMDSAPANRLQSRPVLMAASAADVSAVSQADGVQPVNSQSSLICTSITADGMQGFLEEIKEAAATGVDLIELRLDFIKDFDPSKDLQTLMSACTVPYVVTYRPKWEG